MAGAQADHERFGTEHLGGDPGRFGDRAAGEGHIDVAGSDSVQEIGQPHPLQVDSYLRRFGGEQIDQVGGEQGGGGGGDAQPHGAFLAVGDASDRGLGGGGLVENDLRTGEQFGAGAGQGDLTGGTGEQRGTQFALQAANQFAERRRGDMQPLGGPPEVQFGGYCH